MDQRRGGLGAVTRVRFARETMHDLLGAGCGEFEDCTGVESTGRVALRATIGVTPYNALRSREALSCSPTPASAMRPRGAQFAAPFCKTHEPSKTPSLVNAGRLGRTGQSSLVRNADASGDGLTAISAQ